MFFVSKDNNLNKAHVKHLEARLLERAKAANQRKLDNAQSSLQPSLSEAETADVESFLLDMLSIFPLLGLNAFEKTEAPQKSAHLFYVESKSIKATGYEDTEGFVIVKGSQVVKSEVASHRTSTLGARNGRICVTRRSSCPKTRTTSSPTITSSKVGLDVPPATRPIRVRHWKSVRARALRPLGRADHRRRADGLGRTGVFR